MTVPNTPLGVAYSILAASCFALLSYLFNTPVRGHRLTIARLSLFAAHGIRYEALVDHKSYAFSFSAPLLTWSLHLPHTSDPRWATVLLHDAFYTSTSADVAAERLTLKLWLLPVLFRHTAGAWADVALAGLRIRVRRSTDTPYWIQRLRANLVTTLLTGEVLRADLFRTAFHFGGLFTAMDERSLGESDRMRAYTTTPLRTHDPYELCFSLAARGLLINNGEGRMYTFGSIDSQLRRDWAKDRGSFALVAEECQWVRVLFPYERVAPRPFSLQLLSSILHFPYDLWRNVNCPIRTTNLSVTRLDVTFDAFRLRDAELLRQAVVLLREQAITSGVNWNEVFFDAIAQALAC
ncbi:uncharacterized protein BXZ73DRAFT_51130 [Epithele typhae]|uniref:uncharacterized protein n=1 Tax=Epithele typhae TaxID=378194 RepID=UPI0020078747|nr:uncharacterized protein BXZ73DRAFT_51130 [Epithele typhae]KAH9923122.1 hypothetical protein BXZ73DRAFT_51130 [Epithele typhae]